MQQQIHTAKMNGRDAANAYIREYGWQAACDWLNQQQPVGVKIEQSVEQAAHWRGFCDRLSETTPR